MVGVSFEDVGKSSVVVDRRIAGRLEGLKSRLAGVGLGGILTPEHKRYIEFKVMDEYKNQAMVKGFTVGGEGKEWTDLEASAATIVEVNEGVGLDCYISSFGQETFVPLTDLQNQLLNYSDSLRRRRDEKRAQRAYNRSSRI